MPEEPLSLAEFEQIVDEALESIPKRFSDLVRNIAIAVEDEPTRKDLGRGGKRRHELLGIYRGVPLTKRSHDDPLLPDEIVIFRGPIRRVSRTRDEAVRQVRDTVIHEIGHYFGLSDEEMPH